MVKKVGFYLATNGTDPILPVADVCQYGQKQFRNMGAAPGTVRVADQDCGELRQMHDIMYDLCLRVTKLEDVVSQLSVDSILWARAQVELGDDNRVFREPASNPGRTRSRMDTGSAFVTESYRIRPHLYAEALRKCKITPQIDAFSKADTRMCSRFWGPGSPAAENAFDERWDRNILWCNPPFSMIQAVSDKVKAEAAHCLLLVPEWPTKSWWADLQPLAVWRWRIPANVKVFEMFHRPCAPTRWPVHVLAVCGAQPRCSLQDLQSGRVHGVEASTGQVGKIVLKSRSHQRRWRRQVQKAKREMESGSGDG